MSWICYCCNINFINWFNIYFFVKIAIFFITNYDVFSFGKLLYAFIPFSGVSSGFTNCFLLFYLFIPFINVLVNHLNEKEHILLIALIIFTYSVISLIPTFPVVFNYVTWFICIFIIASYFRLYPHKIFTGRKWGWLSLALLLISILSIIGSHIFGTKYGYISAYFFVADSNKILAVITSLTWFLFFKNLNIKQSKVINLIASTTFGVLLIHANSDTMRRWLWKDLLNVEGFYSKDNWVYLHVFLSVIGIFIVCSLIDLIRQYTIEIPWLKFWDKLFHKIYMPIKTKYLSYFK